MTASLRRTLAAILLLAPLAAHGRSLQGAGGAQPAITIVTINETGPKNLYENLEAWQFSSASGSYQKTWAARPRFVDGGSATSFVTWPGLPVIADYDGDGLNDLIVPDRFGITVYGATPAYHPFAVASPGGLVHLTTCDVDGDGIPEVVTQRQSDAPDRPGQPSMSEIETWKVSRGLLVSLDKHPLPTGVGTYVLGCEDVDADGRKELITAGETIQILTPKDRTGWQTAAELPVMGYIRPGQTGLGNVVDVVRVADVNADGVPEILTGGNSGRLTIFRHARLTNGSDSYPVIWKSPVLHGSGLSAFTQGLAAGDVDNDGAVEILVGTVAGQIHVFKFDGQQDFRTAWTSGPVQAAAIPAFALGDLKADGRTEFVYNGRDVYEYDPPTKGYRVSGRVGSRQSEDVRGNAVVGQLPSLREPAAALRVVPVGWSLPLSSAAQPELQFGETATVSISLRSIWAAVRDVTLEMSSDIPGLIVKNGPVRISAIPSGSTVASPPLEVQAPDRSPAAAGGNQVTAVRGFLRITISAAGGYKQVVPLRVSVTDRRGPG